MLGDETDRDDQNIADPLFAERRDHIACKRLEPFHRTNFALKRQLVWIPAFDPIHDQLHGFLGLFQIRVTFANVTFGNAMGAEENVHLAGIGEVSKLAPDGVRKRFNVSRLIRPRANPLDMEFF